MSAVPTLSSSDDIVRDNVPDEKIFNKYVFLFVPLPWFYVITGMDRYYKEE